MNRIEVYDTHTEIINGLFIDIPDEEFTFLSENTIRDESEGVTKEQFEAAYPRQSDGLDFDEAPFIIGTSLQGSYIVGFDPIDLSDTINSNEETSHQLRNMSEQELLEHFDRISQEE